MPDPILPEGMPSSTPLTEVSPEAVDELFSRDPLKLSNADIEKLVLHFRAERHQWQRLEAEGKTRSKPRGKKATTSAPMTAGDVDDILGSL